MNAYNRLTLKEREEMSRYLAQGYSLRGVAKQLQRNVSTISREVRKGTSDRYKYRAVRSQLRAQRKAARRKTGKRKIVMNRKLKEYVYEKLRMRWSPKQIAEILKREYSADMTMRIAPETIYTSLYVLPKGELKRELLKCLRRWHRYRRKRAAKSLKAWSEN